jgi:hypothetical protein
VAYKLSTRLVLITLATMAIVTLAFAACGGSDEKTPDDSTAEATATRDSGGGDATPTEAAGEDAAALFRSRAQDHETVSGKATYTLSSSGGDDQTMTIYSRGSDSRIDIIGEDGEITVILETADGSYICSADQCIESPAGGGSLVAAFAGLFQGSAISDAADGVAGVDIDTFDEEIAGEDARCFKVSSSVVPGQGTGEAEWCFADDGLLLRSVFRGAGVESSLEATEVSRDVSDADFAPPYEVVDIGS